MKRWKDVLAIALVEVFTCFLYVWGLWNEGLANLYYSAGVYSMAQNWHVFFFNSLDSAGFISIDKPPLGFWIQVLFVKIFGFGGMSTLLPQAIAGMISVYLLYRMIGKRFGKAAGIASALVLAFTPILAAVTRNNTIDSVLILMLILASGQLIRAAEESSPKHLLIAGVFIGLGFNVKMLQAFMIVPAVYLTYFMFSKQTIVRRLLSCLLSFAILILVSSSWMLAVDLTPAQDRPYVGSSGTNSEFALAYGYNGLKRLGMDDQNAQQQGDFVPAENDNDGPSMGSFTTGGPGRLPVDDRPDQPPEDNDNPNPPANGGQTGGEGGGRSEGGTTSLFRLFNSENAGQISWLLIPVVGMSILGLFGVLRRKKKNIPKTVSLFYLSMCFIPMFIYFSFSGGMAHRYYLAMLAFPIAALAGIGVHCLINKRVNRVLLLAVFAVTAVAQVYIQSLYTGWLAWLVPTCAAVFGGLLIIVAFQKTIRKALVKILLASLLILPAIWSFTPLLYGNNAQLPIAGPELLSQEDSFDRQNDLTELIAYLKENSGDTTYLACVPSAMQLGAELILASGEPVMCLGGFNGADQPLSIEEFKQLILQGAVRFAIVTDNGSPGANAEINQWIAEHCGLADRQFGGGALYDLSSFQQ